MSEQACLLGHQAVLEKYEKIRIAESWRIWTSFHFQRNRTFTNIRETFRLTESMSYHLLSSYHGLRAMLDKCHHLKCNSKKKKRCNSPNRHYLYPHFTDGDNWQWQRIRHLSKIRQPANNTLQRTEASPKTIILDLGSPTRTWQSTTEQHHVTPDH